MHSQNLLKGFLFWVLIFSFGFPAFSQNASIEGTVRDAKTKEVLPYASVFINQTTRGSITDSNGYFAIRNLSIGKIELVCTFVGYKTFSINIEIKGESIILQNISLIPEVTELKKVEVITTHDDIWETQLKKFSKIFIGRGPYSTQCKILNPWNLEFKEEKIRGNLLFTASCGGPIEIENIGLGYHVTFYLKIFESDAEGYIFGGAHKFTELFTSDSSLAKMWETNRAKAFLGSARHLIKSLKQNRSKEEGFDLYFKATPPPYQISGGFSQQLGKTIFPLNPKAITISEIMKNHYLISFGVPVLEIHYTRSRLSPPMYPDVSYPVSWLQIKGERLAVNENGIVLNPGDLVAYGAMSETRIADLLPDDYSPRNSADQNLSSQRPSLILSADKQEKVYLHTDKNFYYPGENIWFKAYMNYRSQIKADSLSRVLYVELISNENKIIATKILKINNGVAIGQIELPDSIYSGNYFIRAYTEWMLNYSTDDIFTKYFPVLRKEEKVGTAGNIVLDSTSIPKVIIKSDKPFYRTREKIEVRISVKDEMQNALAANLSISVTDKNQTHFETGKTILNSFSFNSDLIKPTHTKYQIESGINLSGVVKNKRGKPVAENLLLTKNVSGESVLIDTQTNGGFSLYDLQVEDTVTFLIKSVSPKKQADHVDLNSRHVPPFTKPIFKPIKVEADTSTRRSVFNYMKSTILRPVTVIAAKLDDQKTKEEYANFIVDGETLSKLNPNSILYGLNARFPFIRINTVYENGLVPVQRVDLKSNYTYGFNYLPEPALFINGLQVNMNGEPIYDILFRIPPDQVERVEINKQPGSGSTYSTTFGYRGSISITLKSNMDANRFKPKMSPSNFFHKIKIEGYQITEEFKSPDYSSSSSSTDSDFRSTIYWNPQVLINNSEPASVTFYAADLPTKYRIEIEGVTATGKPVRSVSYIAIVK